MDHDASVASEPGSFFSAANALPHGDTVSRITDAVVADMEADDPPRKPPGVWSRKGRAFSLHTDGARDASRKRRARFDPLRRSGPYGAHEPRLPA